MSSDDETIKNFVINEDDIYKLKSIIKSLSDIQSEIKAKEANLENIKNEILKTELAYKSLVKDYSSYDLDAVNTLSREIEEGLNEYYAFSAEINNDEKNLKEISTNANLKNVLIYGIIIFAVIGGIIISTIKIKRLMVLIGIFSIK